jgi:hypothetical protein
VRTNANNNGHDKPNWEQLLEIPIQVCNSMQCNAIKSNEIKICVKAGASL